MNEDMAVANVLKEFLFGRKVLDVGCGTGLLLELLPLPEEDYLGIDPSAGMLERLHQKFPQHCTKQKCFGEEDLKGVDVAVSIFGPVSYMPPEVVFKLVSSGVNYFLMFYKDGYRPVTYEMTNVDFQPYPFQSYNLPRQDFGNFAIVTNLRFQDGCLAFPITPSVELEDGASPGMKMVRAKTEPGGVLKLYDLQKYKSFHSEDDLPIHKGASLGGTVLTILNAYLGSGILVLPYAWSQAGWLFVIPFVAMAVMMGFTLWLSGFLLRLVDARAVALDVPQSSRDWGMLGSMAFGRCGHMLFSGCAIVDLYGGIVSGLILTSDQLQVLLPEVSSAVMAAVLFGLLLLLLFVPDRYFSSVAAVGLSIMLIILASLLITGGELVALGELAEDQVMLNWAGISPATGVAIYSFMVHSEAPLVYQLMEDRSRWTQAVLCSSALAAIFFVGLAMVCYSFFGGRLAQSFPENLGRSLDLELLPGQLNGVMSYLSLLAVSLKLLVNVPLLAAPIIQAFKHGCGLRGRFSCAVLKLGMALVTAVLCWVLKDDAALIIELVGIVPQNFTCIVLPCAALLKLHGDQMGYLRRGLLGVLTLSFAVYGVAGTVQAVLETL